MRFGIMAMQIDRLIPSGADPRTVIQQLGAFSHAAHVRGLAQAGFQTIELGGDLGLFLPQSFSAQSVEQLAALKQELGIAYTVHLPLWSVEPSTPLGPVREGSVCALIESINATRSLEPEAYVLHATGALAAEFTQMRLPESARSPILQLFQAGAHQSIQTILAETGIPSRRLAVETIEFPFDLTLQLAEASDTSICFDTGHVLVGFSGPVDFFDALERCLPRLAEVHLHDGPWQGPERRIGYGKDHQPLGNGDLQVGRFLARLEAAGFTGPLIFELRVDEAMASLDHLRKLELV